MGLRSVLKVILVFCLLGSAAVGATPQKQRETHGRVGEKPRAAMATAAVAVLVPAADLDALIATLEAKIAVASDASKLRPALATALARRASAKAGPVGESDKALLMQTLGEFRRAKEMAPDAPGVWQEYLTYLLARPEQMPVAATEGQEALDSVFPKLSRPLSPAWKSIAEKLEALYAKHDMPLFRVQCLELIAQSGDASAASATKLLVVARETAKRRSPETLSRLDAALSLGDLAQADILLNGLRRLDPAMPAILVFQKRLRTVRQVENLLIEIRKAMRDGRPALVRDLCGQVLKLDPNNPQARALASQTVQPGTATTSMAVPDETTRKTELIRELSAMLAEAESRDDLTAARRFLREFVVLGLAQSPQITRLQQIEQELLEARFMVSQRFDEAQSLFESRSWEKLRRLLNRNPGLGDSTERVIHVWEMGLMADSKLGWKDDATLIAEADRLGEKAPKSFWPHCVKLDIALRQGRYADAETLLTTAKAIEPNSRFLTWPSRILWLWQHGWKFAPFAILAAVFLLARIMEVFFAWWERFYWTWINIVSYIFPGLALASLEKKFAVARENEDKMRLYRLLAKCAFATGLGSKGVRYAELILELRCNDADAVAMLGRHYLKQPTQTPAQFAFVMGYAARRPDDRGLIEKLGKSVLAGRAITAEMLPVLGRYLSLFPQDEAMARLLGEFYRGADPMTLTADAIDFMEKAWRKSGGEDMWYNLLRALMMRGLFDRFEKLVGEATRAGTASEWQRLFELVDRQTETELYPIQGALGGMEKAHKTEAMQRVLTLRFVTKKHVQLVAPALDNQIMAEDVGIRYHAQKARDHLRSQTMKTEAFVVAMSQLATPATATATPAAAEGQPLETLEIPADFATTTVESQPLEVSMPVAEPSNVSESQPFEALEAFGEPGPEAEPQPLDIQENVAASVAAVDAQTLSEAHPEPVEPSAPFAIQPGPEMPISEICPNQISGAMQTPGDDAPIMNPMEALKWPALEPVASDNGLPDLAIPDVGGNTPVEPIPGDGPSVDEIAESAADLGYAGELPPLEAALDAQSKSEHEDLSGGVHSAISEVGEKIRNLADEPDLAEIRTLIAASTAADTCFWREYLSRPPAIIILETVPRLLGMKRLPELVSVFAALLEGQAPRVRANAVEALEENADPAAIPVLVSLFRDDDNRVKANAIKAMSQFGVETVLEELRGMIEDPRVEMRDSATYVLKSIRGEEPAILLERLLRDGSSQVRFNAIRSLAAQGDPGNTQRLMEYLPEVADPEERDLLFKSISELQKSS